MPRFLEDQLRQEYGDNPHKIFGTMNTIGAMRGNKTTDKGRAMEVKHNAKITPMFRGGAVLPPYYDPNDPEQQFPGMPPPPMPQEGMDPTAEMAPPPMPTALSRFDTQPDAGESGGGPPPEPPIEQGPPPSPDAIGRDPRYRNLAIQQKMTQDQAPPPMPGLRNQGAAQQQAIDYAQKILMDPKHPGQFKQPSVLQNVLGAIAPRFNMHPNLTRQYQNYELLKSRADEERKMQQAQSAEEIKKDTLETNRTSREATAQNQRSAAEDRKLRLMMDPNLEEFNPAGSYRGTVDVGGKQFGVLPPEVLAERKKKAEQVNWLEVPKPLQEEFGLAPRAPKETVDNALRLLEIRGQKEAADAMRRELAAQQDQLRRNLAGENNRTRKEIADASNATRRDVAATTPHGTFSPIYDKDGNITEFYNPLTQEHAPAPRGATKPLGSDAQKRIASARATVDAAGRAIQLIEQIRKDHPNYVGAGPVSRTVAGVRSATSTEPAEFGAADTALESAAALQPGQHGFRSVQALNQFKQSLGIDPKTGKATGSREWLRNPQKAIEALREVSRFNEQLARDVRGGTPAAEEDDDPMGIFKK